MYSRHLATLAIAVSLVAASACAGPAEPPVTTQPAGQPAGAGLPAIPAFTTLQGDVSAPSRIVAAGGGNIIAAGAGNIIAAAGGSLVAAGGGNVIVNNGGNMVAAGGGNMVAAGGGNLVAAGGGNLVAAGGGNVIVNNGGNMVAAGGGNMVAAGGGNLVQFGARMVAAGGGNMVAAGGGNMVAAGGGNMVAAGGGNMVAAGGGNYRVAEGPRRHLNAIEMSPIPSTPVVGGRVLLSDVNGKDVPIPPTYTDANGHYSIPNVPGGGRYIVTVVVGDEAAAMSARTYGLQAEDEPPGGAPTSTGTGRGKTYKDLANPLVIGIALPNDQDQQQGQPPTGDGDPEPEPPPPSAEDRDDLFLKTFASTDQALVEADITLATTVILEALVLSAGQSRGDVKPEQWAAAVEKLTPLLREINPRSLPKELLESPIVDAVEEPAKAREVLEGWTILRPDITDTLWEIEKVLFRPDAPVPTNAPEGQATNRPEDLPTSNPEPVQPPTSGGSGGGYGNDGAEDDVDEEEEPQGIEIVPGGFSSPTASPNTFFPGGF